MQLKHFVVVVASMSLLVGCSKKSSSPTDTASQFSPSLAVVPADGQTNVRLDATVIFSFARPVDRAVVERNIHLISERLVADSLCPYASILSHGGMSYVMMDSALMRHAGLVHGTRGRFVWNEDATLCTFLPDSMMSPRTQYMIHMGNEMMQMMQRRMGEMGMMGNHGSGMMQDDMMLHFTTMDTTGTGSGHGGHH